MRRLLIVALLSVSGCHTPTELRCRQDTLRFVVNWDDAAGRGPVDTMRALYNTCRRVRRGAP